MGRAQLVVTWALVVLLGCSCCVNAGYASFLPTAARTTRRRRLCVNRGVEVQEPQFLVFEPPSIISASRIVVQASTLRGGPRSSSTDSDKADEDDDDVRRASGSVETTSENKATENRYRRLKDLMWVRETLEDLTAAEFACSVESLNDEEDNDGDKEQLLRKKKKRNVDYEKLLNQLNRRLRDMGCADTWKSDALFRCDVQAGVGLASSVYTDEQRGALMERLIRTRMALIEIIQGVERELLDSETGGGDDLPFSISLPEIRVQIPKEYDEALGHENSPKLYVRDDGTVDWDGALQDRAALQKFGTAVWARINGRDPENIDGEDENRASNSADSKSSTAVGLTAKIVETPEIERASRELDLLEAELLQMEVTHTTLLSSSLAAGQAVANVNLATLEPSQRNKIRLSVRALEKKKEQIAFQRLALELERIYTFLRAEVANPALKGYIPLQDRLNVAEFGLLESQMQSFNTLLETGESVDSDVLAVVMEQVTDLKRRLGIDYYVTSQISLDGEAAKRWAVNLLEKTKKSIAFYIKGCQLFWNDIVFCLSLVNRAAQGYTLKPREVRTLRRTFKDIITFVPVVIILIIPLTPVGHVLVFGAIQRFFPGFFPSCFTEQRQNLLELYENAEYSEFTIQENWKEKLARLSAALVYFVVNTSRMIYLEARKLTSTSYSGDDEKTMDQ